MAKPLAKIIDAVYEDGVFRPTRRVALPNRSRVRLTLVPVSVTYPKAQQLVVARQRKALHSIVGIGSSGRTDISKRHDKYLYGKQL